MNNKTLLALVIVLLSAILIGNIVIAPFIFTVLIPSYGRIKTAEVTVTWLNGTEVTEINWGIVENNTETCFPELLNVTNAGNMPVTLALSTANPVNVTSVTLAWNYTDTTLQPSDYVVIQLNQTVTATEETFSYDIQIDAVG